MKKRAFYIKERKMNFSEQVKKVKSEKGITNEKLSEKTGIPFSTLNKILSNEAANPKLDVLVSIAKALDCPIGYLIDGEGEFVNQSLSSDEGELVKNYRKLDEHGKALVSLVAEKELERITEKTEAAPARILTLGESKKTTFLTLPLFDLPVSAGLGSFLDGDSSEELEIKATKISSQADFALRVSGNSMEPNFRDGDILLVKKGEEVGVGELGVFIGDGMGYFKRYMGDCLRSLNPDYKDIPLSYFSRISCYGKVIGQLPR